MLKMVQKCKEKFFTFVNPRHLSQSWWKLAFLLFQGEKIMFPKTGQNVIRSLKEQVSKKDKPGGGGSKPKVPFINTFFSTLKGSLIKEIHQYLKSSDKSLTHNIQVKVLQHYQSGVCVYCSQIRLDVERGRKRH